jgi:rhodanese-related sulfurtransferase
MTDSTIQTISVPDARNILADGQAVFIDIRDPDSYERAHIPGAIRS